MCEKLSPVEVSARYIAHVRDAWNSSFSPRAAGEARFRAHFAGFVRRSRPGVDGQSGGGGRIAAGRVDRRAAGRFLRLDLRPSGRLGAIGFAGPEDFDLRYRRRNFRLHPHPRPPRRRRQSAIPSRGGRRTLDPRRRQSRFGAGEAYRAENRAGRGRRNAEGGSISGDVQGNVLESGGTAEREQGTEKKLDPRQWAVLTRICRAVKETLLGPDAPEHFTVNLPGGGSRLIGGGIHVEVTRDEVQQLLVDGFFPKVSLDAKPLARRSGFQEFGLPFAADAAITKYLAAFLTAHRHVALDDMEPSGDHDPARPDIVLLNGGVFESPMLKERLLEVMTSWFAEQPSPSAPTTPWCPHGQPSIGARRGKNRLAADPPRQRPARSGRRARSGILRHGSPRTRCSHRRRFGANVLHRRGG